MTDNSDLQTITDRAMKAAGLSSEERNILIVRFRMGCTLAEAGNRLARPACEVATMEREALRKLRCVPNEIRFETYDRHGARRALPDSGIEEVCHG